VDCPFTILDGRRFSGEDSSAKLCIGGEVSELPPDLGPTAKLKQKSIKIKFQPNSRPWKDQFKSDLRSDQDHRQKNDLRSDQDHLF
jgi:hypothetical protein